MATTPQHMFHGYASGFGARIERPLVRQAAEAATALTPVGGRASAVSRGYHVESLLSYEEATSMVLGHYYAGKDGVELTAETRVSAAVKGLVVPGVLTADRISMALVSERDFPQGMRRFRLEEARIEKLRIQGVGDVEFDAARSELDDLAQLGKPGGATEKEVQALRRETPDALYALGTRTARPSLVRQADPAGDGPPAFSVVKGELTFKIHLIEVLVRHGAIDLTMLRVEIHRNPRDGSFAAASGGVNGNPST